MAALMLCRFARLALAVPPKPASLTNSTETSALTSSWSTASKAPKGMATPAGVRIHSGSFPCTQGQERLMPRDRAAHRASVYSCTALRCFKDLTGNRKESTVPCGLESPILSHLERCRVEALGAHGLRCKAAGGHCIASTPALALNLGLHSLLALLSGRACLRALRPCHF